MTKIKYKRYRIYKLIIVVLLTIIASCFVALGNFIIPLAALLVATILMFILQKNVEEVMTDERINQISGKASRIVMTISVSLMSVAGIVLVSLRNIYPQYQIIGNIFLYLECGMMLLYSILFKCFSRRI
jgi:uncharacterized membrane protein